DSRGLRERFGQEYSGNERITRKMAGKNRIVLRKTRFTFRGKPRLAGIQLLDENERRPMRKAGEQVRGQKQLSVNEISKLPAAPDPRDADAVAVVIQRGIGKLRRR